MKKRTIVIITIALLAVITTTPTQLNNLIFHSFYDIISTGSDIMSRKQEYKVELTNEQRSELSAIVASSSKRLSPETKYRAKALLCLDELGEKPLSPADTARKCKLHRETIYGIRKQFTKEGLEAVVYRKKRETPPTEPRVTGDVEAHIIAVACSSAPEGKSKWTLQMIADKIVIDGVVDSIGKETVRRTLKKRNISLT